jgi:alkylation response protein AidB-like acyl-CoA dehydrogenase
MNFDLSEDQEMIRDSVGRFAVAANRRAVRAAEGGYPLERWSELAELGLIALAVPEAAGGMGGSRADLAIVAEGLGHKIAPDPWLENGVLPARLLAAAGGNGLAPLLAGEALVALAFAERGQRFSLTPRSVAARRTASGFEINGEKTFVMGGALAASLIVSAEMDGQTTLFLIPADRAGVIRHPYRLVDGSIACEVRFTYVEAAQVDLLRISAEALADTVALVRLLAAAEMLGLAQRLFDNTLAYVKQREQFGVAIGSFQALQHRLVECYAALEQARSAVYRTVLGNYADAASWSRAAAGVKAYVGAQVDRIAREAVQMHGGMGITDELAIGHAVKRVALLSRLFGDEDVVLAEYAEAA